VHSHHRKDLPVYNHTRSALTAGAVATRRAALITGRNAQAPPRSRRQRRPLSGLQRRGRVGAIYRAHNTPDDDRWFWGLNGVENGPGPFNGFVPTLEDAKAEFAAAWGAWLKAAGLNEETPTAQLKDSDSGSR
jgi:hypothetical protein